MVAKSLVSKMSQEMNIEHRTSNVQHRTLNDVETEKIIINRLRSAATTLFDVQRWTFDPPEADKCLLAFGELDVRCLSASGGFDVHFFLAAPQI